MSEVENKDIGVEFVNSDINQSPGSDFANYIGGSEVNRPMSDFVFRPLDPKYAIKGSEFISTVTIKPWTVKFIKTNSEAKLPHQASEGAACSDLYSVENVTVYPGKTKMIDTGLQVAHIPSGYRLSLFDRSGFRAKGIFGSSVGIIDEDYRGPLKVILYNSTDIPLEISVGDRIAQAALEQKISVKYEFTETFEDTDRGAGGFGSTGKN